MLQEAIVLPPWIVLAVRPRPGVWDYVRVNVDELVVEQLSVAEYLEFKEQLVNGSVKDNYVLELDLEPFNASFSHPTQPSSIGSGVQFLNRHLSSRLFHGKESMQPLLDFLRAHNYRGQKMILNERIQSLNTNYKKWRTKRLNKDTSASTRTMTPTVTSMLYFPTLTLNYRMLWVTFKRNSRENYQLSIGVKI